MKTFVLITALCELIAGALFFVVPHLVPGAENADVLSLTWMRMYGVAAMSIGYYALLAWKNFAFGPARGFTKVFFVFHIGVAVALYFGYHGGYTEFLGGVGFHLLMAILTIFFGSRLKLAN